MNYISRINTYPFIADQNTATPEELVLAHLRLVTSHVIKTYGRTHELFDDLVQIGNLSLVKCAQTFDPSMGFSFTTYAISTIKHDIMNFMVDGKDTVRTLTTKPIRKAFFNASKFKLDDGSVDKEKMSDELNISVRDIEEMMERRKWKTVSIDNKYNEDGEEEDITVDLIDENADPVIVLSCLEEEARIYKVQEVLSKLTEREHQVITARYLQEDAKTFMELADEFGVSFQRVQQIEQNAIKKLKKFIDNPVSN